VKSAWKAVTVVVLSITGGAIVSSTVRVNVVVSEIVGVTRVPVVGTKDKARSIVSRLNPEFQSRVRTGLTSVKPPDKVAKKP
jgi:hypothetical protein